MTDDLQDMVQDDLQKVRAVSGSGMDTSLPAMIELGFGVMTALVALVWFIALYWTPDPIGGTTWMGIGMLGMALFGLPAGIIYILRRGGAVVIMRLIQSIAR